MTEPLRLALGAAGAVDVALGALLVTAPRALLEAVGVPPPSELAFARLCGVLLAGAGGAALIAARDPRRHEPIVVLVGALRPATAAWLVTAWNSGWPAIALVLAAIETLLGAAHLLHAARLRRARA